MASSIEDLCNQALRRIGYEVPIGYIYEGSKAARVAVEIYGQARDALLMESDWDFARQSENLQLLKVAPVGGYSVAQPWTAAYPPVPWIYEYAYPAGCLMVRSVRPQPLVIPELDPQPNIFVLADDASLPTPSKVVLTNLANAVAVYTGQITDPTQWNAMFTEAFVAALATRFQMALAPEPNADKEKVEQESQDTALAAQRRG